MMRRRYRQIFRPRRYLAQLSNYLCWHFDAFIHSDPHVSGQATQRDVKRGKLL
jgi:hypothetical protein